MKPLVVLAGPTGVGKSDLSIKLANRIGGEIISADSMQVYRKLDIGTAKITKEEMCDIRHHMLDVFDPDYSCDIEIYQRMVKECIDNIISRNHIPMLVGGTGFYIQAITKDVEFLEEDNTLIRQSITDYYDKYGMDALFERLDKIDHESALIIPKQNIKKVIRAIEFYEIHKSKISDYNLKQAEKVSPYNLAYFVLNRNRDELYDNINKRVDIMISKGLLEEVKSLIGQYDYNSQSGFYNAIGYKEIIEYINGKCSLEDAIEQVKLNSRHYAKKQITFFKRSKDAIWFNKSLQSEDEILNEMINILSERKIYE